ncbi:hypothetical protein D3C75_1129050 [compost metagenome]
MQRLVIGFAFECSRDAVLGQGAEVFASAEIGIQENVACVDGIPEVFLFLNLVDIQIHSFAFTTPKTVDHRLLAFRR